MLKVQKLNGDATVPTKREEDGGYDIYPSFAEDEFIIEPLETKLVPTGIATAFDKDKVALLRERGSTGTRGMSLKAGVIDSGYRGEWFVAINNTSDKTLVISKNVNRPFVMGNYQFYPYIKGIAQFTLVKSYHENPEVVEDINQFESERGKGKLGSSNK